MFDCWSEEAIKQFEDCWPIGTRARMAFDLHLYTGQTHESVRTTVWSALEQRRSREYDDRREKYVEQTKISIRVVSYVTNGQILIPAHDNLLRSIVAWRKCRPDWRASEPIVNAAPGCFLCLHDYVMFTTHAIDVAGLPIGSFASLAVPARHRLAQAGCSAKQIENLTGKLQRQSKSLLQRLTEFAKRVAISVA